MLVHWLLAAMLHLAPNRDHAPLVEAMNKVITEQAPLFKNDPLKQRTAALLVSINFREGSLRPDIMGDKQNGKFTSFCSMQIHLPFGGKSPEGWTGEDLVADPVKCITVGMRMLRESMRMCPKHPVAFYAEGQGIKTCDSIRAQRISNDRMFLASRLVKEVEWASDDTSAQPALRTVPPPMHAPWLLGAPGH